MGANKKKRKGKGKANVKGNTIASGVSKLSAVERQEMEDVEMEHAHKGKMFMSLLQDFGPMLDREERITIRGLRTSDYPNTRASRQNDVETQLVVVLKGIGAETYRCLRDPEPPQESKKIQMMQLTRRYLQQLTTTRVNYVQENDEDEKPRKQNIPIVYGPEWLGSERWKFQIGCLQQRWHAQREAWLSSQGGCLDPDIGDPMEEVVASPYGKVNS